MRRFSRIFAWTTLFFVAGAVLFFTKAAALPYKVAWPVLLLSLATFLSRRRELLPFGFAFLFSAAGDAVGARGLFIPQMAFFALAHVAYVCWFLPRARRRLRAVSLAVTVPLLVFLFAAIVPEVPFPAERIGVAVYGLVIAAMLYSALQYDGACAAGFRCAALLFVFFRRGDRLEPLHRTGSGPDLDRYDHLLPRAIPLFPLRLQNRGPELTLTAPVSPAAAGL